MTPISRLGYFALATIHLLVCLALMLTPVIHPTAAFIARLAANSILFLEFFHILGLAIKNDP